MNKKRICTVLIALMALLVQGVEANASDISVSFSPHRGTTEAIVELISEAKQSIDVAAYGFTSTDIARALLKAQERGVAVRLVLDKSNETARYSAATFFMNAHVPLRIDHRYAIMHNKYMIVDHQTVETGSFNFTKAAENNNAENALIIRDDPELAKTYEADWQRLRNESREFSR